MVLHGTPADLPFEASFGGSIDSGLMEHISLFP
jgi:hypothetical protein